MKLFQCNGHPRAVRLVRGGCGTLVIKMEFACSEHDLTRKRCRNFSSFLTY